MLPPVHYSDYGQIDHVDDLAVWLMTHLGDLRWKMTMMDIFPSFWLELVFCPYHILGQSFSQVAAPGS